MPITIAVNATQTRQEIVDRIIEAVGRDIQIQYLVSTGTCILCSGQDPFCITCSGQPYIEYTSTKTVSASIRWGSSENKIYTPQGQYPQGDCIVVFSIDQISTNTGMFDTDQLLNKAIRVVVDQRSCIIDKWYYKGSPINRVYLILKEDETLDGNRKG